MIEKILKKFVIFFFLLNFGTSAFGVIQNKILIKIENEIISSYELKNKINTLIVLSNKENAAARFSTCLFLKNENFVHWKFENY